MTKTLTEVVGQFFNDEKMASLTFTADGSTINMDLETSKVNSG